MCGIAGHWSINKAFSAESLVPSVKDMCDIIAHRGPDGHGVFCDSKAALVFGHQRLSIIDLSSGQQPLTHVSGKLTVVFNGEIYNYKELRGDLQNRGHIFKTQSDTEVLLSAYYEWGDDCVHKLKGMFAFSIWDSEKSELFCARDRLGVKPFYYCWTGCDFVFCSEVKGILANNKVRNELDFSQLNGFLSVGYNLSSDTFFKHVKKLPPGCSIRIRGGQFDLKQYWSIDAHTNTTERLSFEDASVALREKLDRAVGMRLISDVPVGAFLSGGLDSSTIVTLMAKNMQNPVKTHCVGFNKQGFDERVYAREVANMIGSSHQEHMVSVNIGEKLEEIIWHMDEPFADASAVPTYYLCKEARSRVKVCLSGDGGDELFCGYSWYTELEKLRRLDSILPSWLRNSSLLNVLPYHRRGATLLKNLGSSQAQRHANIANCFNKNLVGDLLTEEFMGLTLGVDNPLTAVYESLPQGGDEIKNAQLVDLKTYLVEDILMKVDKMSMAHSLEVRVPFLDHEVVEFAFQQPTSYKMKNGDHKLLLKKSMSKLVPESVLNRKKQGFSVPIKDWLSGDLKERVGDLLLTSKKSQSGMFKTATVEKIWKKLQNQGSRDIDLSQHIWTLLCFEIWHQQYAKNKFK